MCAQFKKPFMGLPGPVVKNLPFNGEDVGSVPVRDVKIPRAPGQPAQEPQLLDPACGN